MTHSGLRCAAALSLISNAKEATSEVCREALTRLGETPHLAMVFVSASHGKHLAEIAGQICDALGTEQLLGCTGESIVGGDLEIEEGTAISLWLAHWPGVEIVPFRLQFQAAQDGGVFSGWPDVLADRAWPDHGSMVLLGEPYSFPADALLERMSEDRPGVRMVGGMASGGYAPGENQLVLGRNIVTDGAVAVLLHGALKLRTIVSQGCRPIGKPLVITKAERNIIFELGGKPALAQVAELFPTLSPREQQLIRTGLHVGRVTSEYREEFFPGDFLIRNVIGTDGQSGAIAVGDFMRTGQTIQFHVRDQQTADEDLRELIVQSERAGAAPIGALLFTCNGRGTRLFSDPHHDASVLISAFPNLPLAGFFAQGEIGPISEKNYLHGLTASVALFEAP